MPNLKPPSKEEMDELAKDPRFATPTKEELGQSDESPSIGNNILHTALNSITPLAALIPKEDKEDTLRGVASGASFGTAPMITGGLEAGKDILTGTDANKFLDLYRKHQLESSKEYKDAKDRSPMLYGAGQLAGGVASGALTAGASAEAGAGLTGSELANLGALGLAKETGKAALKGAAVGAGIGGLQGGAESEGNLDTLEGAKQLGSDALGGAEVGGAIGGVLSSAAPLAKVGLSGVANSEFVQNRPTFQQIFKSFKEGQAGTHIAETKPFLDTMQSQQTEDIRGITNTILNAENKLGAQLGDAIDSASQSGIKINPSQDLKDILTTSTNASGAKDLGLIDLLPAKAKLVGAGNISKLTEGLKLLQQGNLDPKTAYNLRKQIMNITSNMEADPSLQKMLYNVGNMLKEDISNAVPNLKPLTQQFNQLRRAGTETLLAGGQPSEFADIWAGDLSNKDLALSKAVTNLLDTYSSPGTAKMGTRRAFGEMVSNLQKFDQANPGKLQELGLDIPSLVNNVESKANDFTLVKQVLGYEPHSDPLSHGLSLLTGGTSNTPRGVIMQQANTAGLAANKVSNALKNVPTGTLSNAAVATYTKDASSPAHDNSTNLNELHDFSSALYKAPEDTLRKTADKLKSQPGVDHLGEALMKSIDNKNEAAKNAALFTILQNPQARAALQDGN